MKIAIDCADLDCSRIDGTRVYIKNVLNYLGQLAPNDEFLLYHKGDFNPLLLPKWYPNYVECKIPYRFWWTQTRLAFELRADKPDVCWMPIQQIPFIGPKETKYVVTIHDLAFKIFPDYFLRGDRRKLNFFADTAIKHADGLIAISESTKKDILKLYPKTNKEKISVVHHGFESDLFSKQYSNEEIDSVLKKYKIIKKDRHPFILYVGAIQPRKDLVTLVRAFERIKYRDGNDGLELVLVGELAWKAEKTLVAVENSEFSKDIVLTGKVNFKDLGKIYQGANVFAFPALYEGFGIPILEAFASKVPVVVADNSSLVEVGGEAVQKFEGGDINQFADVLQKVLKNSIIRERMISKGLERAAQFSWKKCAQETLNVLKSA
ncbi:MAG: glycosyltransferase family 1 protein [Patescibacteria group bacterium]|nr:glycosyltransferase family 1 protein [Patescibacteria group bacterium]